MSEFDKIIGYKDVKEELMRICDVVKNTQKYKELGVNHVGGLLLDGEPGVGKTLMATCFIKESGRKAFICRKDKPNGEFVNEIKKIFKEASENTPSIVFLDDMDKFANEDATRPDAQEYVTVQSCIDECKDKDVFVIATINKNRMPNSLLRAGRFDFKIGIDVPEREDAKEIIKYYLSQKKNVEDVSAEDVAKLLYGKSCATLESVINIAAQYSGYFNKNKIDIEDITKAALRVIYNAPECSIPRNKTELKKIAYHEAGHTVVAEMLEEGSVNFVTTRKYMGSAAGITSLYNSEDYWISIKKMENRVLSILGGKAATEIIFGEVDTGCGSDITRARGIVYRFLAEYGGCGFEFTDNGSETTNIIASKIEDRVSIELEKYYLKAKEILFKNKDFLEVLAQRLQEKDTLLEPEILEIKRKTCNNK